MLGAIAGDVIGSAYEFHPCKGGRDDFPLFTARSRFTDDTVLTFAVAQALMDDWHSDKELEKNLVNNIVLFAKTYPKAGYGGKFFNWVAMDNSHTPYNSFGNGSAMRVSPVAYAFKTLEEVEKYAKISAEITHNHPEGIKGACAVAGSIFLARHGKSKEDIRKYVTYKYGYDLDRTLAEIQPSYAFNETCQGSVPEAIIAFLESGDFESAIRNAVWLGGDADTQADIAGSIAEAFYKGVPEPIARETLSRLDKNLYGKYVAWTEWLNGHA